MKKISVIAALVLLLAGARPANVAPELTPAEVLTIPASKLERSVNKLDSSLNRLNVIINQTSPL